MKQETVIEKALTILKDNGLKYTKKREAMITFLAKANRYVSAREVHQFMTQEYPNLSYDTIYRNLHDFAELGLLEETDLQGEMKFRFHCGLQGAAHHHHHFICKVCGKTMELSQCPMAAFKDQLPGCSIEGHRFEVYGRCADCQKIAENNLR